MRVGYVQFRPIFGDKERNIRRMVEFLRSGVKLGAELLVLPELCNTGYKFESADELERLAEEIPNGETTEELINFAEDACISVIAGVCERDGNRYFNSAVLVGPEGFIARYRKAHLFDEENIWFSKGDTPFQVYETSGVKVGIMICFDWFFPEVIRILALKGAQIICHPANLILPYCQTALLGAAVQNRVFIITANRVGFERGIEFTGMSQIVNPMMEVIARSGRSEEEVKVVDIEPSLADSKRITRYNDLWSDRRVDLYHPILERSCEAQK
ncbi:acyltransferase [Candidatus Bathyarchaeota archaeon]|nr:MAG: acyltransferase [Candidatus Bathyarchaeota archaeon]